MPAFDPRHAITPDAFSVHPALLGLPLARPSRRLAAMLLDLLLVAILAQSGGVVLLALAAAYVAFRWIARLTGTGGGFFARALRLGARGVGAVVLFVIALAVADGVYDVGRKLSGGGSAQMGALTIRTSAEREPVARPVPDSVVRAYAAALESGDSAAAAALAPAVGSAFARDSLDELRSDLREARAENRRLEESRAAGVIAWIVDFLDEMGIGLGWTGLYFTAFVAYWKGQTPAKRLLGIRVVRLNGQPMTLWMAFERFGGYAAGLVTGLLGFAQVYWDHNRQAIHDKIVETVVVRERKGAPLPAQPAASPAGARVPAPPMAPVSGG